MKRAILFVVVVALAAGASAQVTVKTEPAEEQISHGVLAQMLLEVIATKEPPQLDPPVALARAQSIGLVPKSWTADTMLTQAEFADVLRGLCPSCTYQPADPDGGVTQPFAAVWIRRTLPCIRHTLAGTLTHGLTENGLGGNLPVAPVPVSPSGF